MNHATPPYEGRRTGDRRGVPLSNNRPLAAHALRIWSRIAGAAIAASLVAVGWTALQAAPTDAVIANIDLSKPFHARSAWRLVATQGPQTPDPMFGEGTVPGSVVLCLEEGAGPCDPSVGAMPRTAGAAASGRDAHYLDVSQVVYPRGPAAAPLLLIRTASLHSGDGDQAVFTQLLAYRPTADRFVQVYGHVTGRNNNQEARFVGSGPLRGDVISAEPTDDKPYAFWVSVSELTPAYTYVQVLRYRSATRYGDGNPLAVIDSEMANIEGRLRLWRPGAPLPLPAGSCPKPRLTKMELWCN
jgi:hypothetical protein